MQNGLVDLCTSRLSVQADELEPEVWEKVAALLDDREYALKKLSEHFAQRRRELSRPSADADTLSRQLRRIETRWVKYQHAYDEDAISVADLKARKAELDNERRAIETELERIRNREEELARLDDDEARARESIETTGNNNLEDATPESRRELYGDLRLRVDVGEGKRPHISGVFPTSVAGITGALLKTPNKRAYLFSREDAGRRRGGR